MKWCLIGSNAGIVVGAAALFYGLFLAFKASRSEAGAIRSSEIREDIVGRIRDVGAVRRQIHLEASARAFRRGLWLTAAGIALQAIGAVLGSFCSMM